MSRKELASIGEVYGKMLNNFKYHNIKEGNSNAFGDQPKLVGKGPDTDGYNKALNDEKPDLNEEDEEGDIKSSKRQDTTQKLKERLKDPKLSPAAKKNLQKQIDLRTAEESEEEIVSESKKISKRTLNNFMSKSVFDKLYNKVLKENFGQEDDTDALGLSDATPDSEFGDEGEDEGEDDLGGEGDEVTFTLPRDVAQQLIDVLQATLGGGEDDFGDDINFDDEGADEFGAEEDGRNFEEDEEEGTKVAPNKSKVFQAKGNKVGGFPTPKAGKAKPDITDETGTKEGAPPITALQGKSNQVPGSTLKKATDYFK